MPAHLHAPAAKKFGPTPADGGLVIGLVNNMPDAAIRSTERQFLSLLDSASGEIDVEIRLFTLPHLPRSETARETFLGAYESIADLLPGDVDGLIVTGAEPRLPELPQEPYWGDLTGLVDWAEDHTISTIWSCLAAHAAVLHLDGINRHALDSKLSGVFECTKTIDHPLVAGSPQSWPVPHSRYNDLEPDELVAGGYRPLTRSPLAGIDSFVKQRNSLFLFFQGHLEYDSHSLLREYLRDITRFLDGQQEHYPEMPSGYFDPDATQAFMDVRDRALARVNAKPLAAVAANAAEGRLVQAWRSPAAGIYRNWLAYIHQQKLARTATVCGSAVATPEASAGVSSARN